MNSSTSVLPNPSKTGKGQRIAYIDLIKVCLTCLVVAHHAAQAYGPTGGVWVVSDAPKADWMGHFFFINASFMMGLYFFISGFFMVYSLKRKTSGDFLVDRVKRLGIPLLFFTIFVFLPFNYFGSGSDQPIFSFLLDTYLNQPPIAVGHLWFVASLLVYSLLFLLFFRKKFRAVPNSAVPLKFWYIPVYIIVLALISGLVRLKYPIDVWKTWIIPVEVAHIPQYFSLFLIGTLFNRNGWMEQLSLKSGIVYLILALSTYLLIMWMPASIQQFWLTGALAESLLCVGISMSFLSFFRHFTTRTTTFTRLLAENTFGIYLFHLFIIILLQEMLTGWKAGPNLKFIVVTIGGIGLSLLISYMARKNRFLRSVL